MTFRNFRLNIVARLVIIILLTIAFAFITTRWQMLFVPVTMILVIAAMIYNLIQYIEKSNNDLTHFLLSLQQGAYTEYYTSGNRGRPHAELSAALNAVVREFANVNLEKELHYQFLKVLNENIGVGIMSFDAAGKLMMMNSAAKKLLSFPVINTIDDINKADRGLATTMNDMKPEGRAVVKVLTEKEQLQLSVQMKELVMQEKSVRIYLLQNINQELEAREVEAWQQLIRVLTHEIMNSVTPIVTLTDAMRSILRTPDGAAKHIDQITSENLEDIHSSMTTISSRGKGLLKFVNTYKEFSKPLVLQSEPVSLTALMNRVIQLMKPELRRLDISIINNIPEEPLVTNGDASLLEQVVINLLKNALEAVDHRGQGFITISLKKKQQGSLISVVDNGVGMDEETMEKIFIPFFTTKSKGTGIGLSLSRQILKLHGGTIRVNSTEGEGSEFTIELP